MATPSLSSAGVTGARSVASYPALASNDSPPLHSVLTDPAKSAASAATNAADSWTSGWGDTAANSSTPTIRGGNTSPTVRDSGLAPLQPLAGSNLSETDSWAQPAQPTLGAANGVVSANRPLSTNAASNNNAFGNNTQPNTQFGTQPNTQLPNGQNTGNFNMAGNNPNPNSNLIGNNGMNTIGTGTIGTGRSQTGSNGTGETQPWMPLIVSVLTLAGSLAANLYLGVSYLDARQKYQSLVRKTADTFRRVKAVAA